MSTHYLTTIRLLFYYLLVSGYTQITSTKIIDCRLITNDKFWRIDGHGTFEQNTCNAYSSNVDRSNYVSIHSFEDIENIGDLCQSCNVQYSWIGIQLDTCNSDEDYKLNWTDASFMNYSYINWCSRYPINICNRTYIYFDASNKVNYCLKNDYDLMLQSVCGNPTQCIYNANEDMWLIPTFVILCIVCIIQCFALKTIYKHLCGNTYVCRKEDEHSKKVTITAIMYSVVQCVQYLFSFFVFAALMIICSSNTIKSLDSYYIMVQYPLLFLSYVLLGVIAIICFICSTFGLFPLHILFRLQDIKEQNVIIKNVSLENKYFSWIMYVAICMEFIIGASIPVAFWWVNQTSKISRKTHARFNWLVAMVFILWAIIDSSIHINLLCCYLQWLEERVKWSYRKICPDQVDTVLITIRKYCVLFGLYVIIIIIVNFILALCQIIWVYAPTDGIRTNANYNMVLLWCVIIRDTVSLSALFLSFKFSTRWYEKKYLCGICDKKMKQLCQERVDKKYRLIQN